MVKYLGFFAATGVGIFLFVSSLTFAAENKEIKMDFSPLMEIKE